MGSGGGRRREPMAAAARPAAVLPGPGRSAPPAARPSAAQAPAPAPGDRVAATQSAAGACGGGGGGLRSRRRGISVWSPVRGRRELRPAAGTGSRGLELIPDGQQNCLWVKEADPLPNSGCGRTASPLGHHFLEEEAGVWCARVNTRIYRTQGRQQEPGRSGWCDPCFEARRLPEASMPWDARPGRSANGGPEGPGAARLRVQKQCRKSSFAFYLAVRDLLPVWLLEDMRASEAFHWDERGRAAAYSPSEALLYALVHDHQAYAHYLLATFPRRALAPPSAGFRCCTAPGPHVALAVRYNRVGILRRILRTVQDFPVEERVRLLDRRGCSRVEGGGTSLHVACELARPECLFLLLGHGASPGLRDGSGFTPLELLLRQLNQDASSAPTAAEAASATVNAATANTASSGEVCQRRLLLLDLLALYTPGGVIGPARCELLGDQLRWQRLLGEDKFQWLAGLAPPSLFVRAMQVLVTTISPGRFPEALDELPLPPFLQPLDLTGKG